MVGIGTGSGRSWRVGIDYDYEHEYEHEKKAVMNAKGRMPARCRRYSFRLKAGHPNLEHEHEKISG